MLVAIAYCQKDEQQAEWLAGWMAELGPYSNHRLLAARDIRSTKQNVFADAGFASVKEIVIKDDAWNSWPISCNNAFRTVGKHIEFGTREPWLWLEADAIPLCAGWLDAIAEEYARAGKPFMGSRVAIAATPVHLSGISVYPGVLSEHAGIAYLAHDVAWDCMAAHQIVPKAHFTNLVDHHWKRDGKTKENLNAPFTSWEQVETEISKEAVIYHASKDGSLIELLRQHRKEGDISCASSQSTLHPIDRPKTSDQENSSPSGNAAPSVQPASDAAEQVPFVPPRKEEIAQYVESKLAEVSEAAELPDVGPGHATLERLLNANVEQTPWASKPDSLAEIQRLADRLKQFGDNASHVRAVRMILNDTGVITLPYRFKKRGKWRRKKKKL